MNKSDVWLTFLTCSCLILSLFFLRKTYSRQIYIVWYVFSFAFTVCVLFLALLRQWGEEQKLASFMGFTFRDIIGHLVDIETEFIIVFGLLLLVIVPQTMAYILSGFTGSATVPVFVSNSIRIAVWLVVKFIATGGGLFLAIAVHSDKSNFLGDMIVISSGWTAASFAILLIYYKTNALAIRINRRCRGYLGRIDHFFKRNNSEKA